MVVDPLRDQAALLGLAHAERADEFWLEVAEHRGSFVFERPRLIVHCASGVLAATDRAGADVFPDASALERAEALCGRENVSLSRTFDQFDADRPMRASAHSEFIHWMADLPASAAGRG
jgi:hypothetical protein